MSLPRRVPWASLTQLEQVYTAIYSTGDWKFAVERLSAWKFAVGLPHALDATLSLLVASEADTADIGTSSKLGPRQAYGLALVRFVNGMVDPLQKGLYARSIASIATNIGLPLRLVELRHACTHEDLPSLELLRDGVKLAFAWLEKHYFVPTLAKVPLQNAEADPPLAPLLKQYKGLAKALQKDRSLQNSMEPQLLAAFQSFDAWIAAVATATWNLWDSEVSKGTSIALEKLCEGLVDAGGLVPVAKKKQPTALKVPSDDFWIPLVDHLQGRYRDFASTFVETLISALFTFDVVDTSERGHYLCLSGWLLWVITNWNSIPGCSPETIAILLFKGCPVEEDMPAHVMDILAWIGAIDSEVLCLLGSLREAKAVNRANRSPWTSDSLSVMEKRLDSSQIVSIPLQESRREPKFGIKGWTQLSVSRGWKESPIGT